MLTLLATVATVATVTTVLGGACPGWLPPVDGPVISAFAPPAAEHGPGHRGVDLAAAPGERVRAPVDGTVAVRGWIGGRPVLVIAARGSRLRATLEPVESTLQPGAPVRRGDIVGAIAPAGSSSHCDGVVRRCLHLGARIGSGSPAAYVDPRRVGCAPVLRPLRPQPSGR